MVLEVALIDVVPGQEDEFATAYGGARELLATTPGCRSVRMTRGVESPSRFVLLVEWDSIEAHLENFRASERFPAWRAQISPYFAAPPVVEHFRELASGSNGPSRELANGSQEPSRELASGSEEPSRELASGSQELRADLP